MEITLEMNICAVFPLSVYGRAFLLSLKVYWISHLQFFEPNADDCEGQEIAAEERAEVF